MTHPTTTPAPPGREATSPGRTTFRLALQAELVRRCKSNPGYSLRAFARAADISPSSLSRLLRGERRISPESTRKVALRLGWNPDGFIEESESVDLQASLERSLSESAARLRQLSEDTFAVISDWYHYAIIELTHVRDFDSDPQWIALRLGVTMSEVHAALERLLRLGLLKRSEDGAGSLVSTGSNTNDVIGADLRAAAYRRLQSQVLGMALTAVEELPIEQRDQTSMTMAINRRRLPEAAARVTRFRRELCAYLEQADDGDKTDVFQLSISLYPLTKPGASR